MKIFVQTTNESISFNVNYFETIESLKSKIEQETGIPKTQQILQFKGKVLENNETLVYYKIALGDTIFLSIDNENKNEIEKNKPIEENIQNKEITELKNQLYIEKTKNDELIKKINILEMDLKNEKNLRIELETNLQYYKDIKNNSIND